MKNPKREMPQIVKQFLPILFLVLLGSCRLENRKITSGSYETNPTPFGTFEKITFKENSLFETYTYTHREKLVCPGIYEISSDTLILNLTYQQVYKDSSRFEVIEENPFEEDINQKTWIELEVFTKSYDITHGYEDERPAEIVSIGIQDESGEELNRIRLEANKIEIVSNQTQKLLVGSYRCYPVLINTKPFKNKSVKIKCTLFQIQKDYCPPMKEKFLITKVNDDSLTLESQEGIVFRYQKMK